MQRADAAQVAEHECAWRRAHEALSRLARQRAQADAEEGRWLLVARRSAAHVHLGFGSFGEYIERLLGYTGRSLQEKLRVAEALEELPSLACALETGALGWSAVRELTRVAVADTEQQWLELAQGKTVRQLEELVAGKRAGDGPDAVSPPAMKRHVLRFEVEPETFALFREAITWLRRQSGDALDDDSALLSMARHVLGGPTDEGRASYQIALRVCPTCGGGEQHTSGELVPVAAEVVAMAECDGQHWVGCPRSPRMRTRFETARPRSKAPLAIAPGSHETPMWAPVRSKRYRPRYAAPCCCATSTAAGCPVAETQRFSISTMSSCAPKGVAMSLEISLLHAQPITERPIAASSSSNATPARAFASGMAMARTTARRSSHGRSKWRPSSSRRYAASAFESARCWPSCAMTTRFVTPVSSTSCAKRCAGSPCRPFGAERSEEGSAVWPARLASFRGQRRADQRRRTPSCNSMALRAKRPRPYASPAPRGTATDEKGVPTSVQVKRHTWPGGVPGGSNCPSQISPESICPFPQL